MPPLEWEYRSQCAVLWSYSGTNNSNGERSLDTPVDIRVRWEWCHEQVKDTKGNNVSIDAWILADRDIPVGSILWRGSTAEWYANGSGTTDVGLVEVKISDSIPDDKGRISETSIGAVRFRNSLPTVI